MNKKQAIYYLQKILFQTTEANKCGLSNNDFKKEIECYETILDIIEDQDLQIRRQKRKIEQQKRLLDIQEREISKQLGTIDNQKKEIEELKKENLDLSESY